MSARGGRLGLKDGLRVATVGLRARRLRAALSALGIAIGTAAIVRVLGLSSSSQAGLLAEIDRLGTNMLTVETGQSLTGEEATLPLEAPGRITHLDNVQQVAQWFNIAGILKPSPVEPTIDNSALIGYPAAQKYVGYVSMVRGEQQAGPPSSIYVRAAIDHVAAVQSLLARTTNPEAPNEVNLSQPSDALTARAAAAGAFDSLFLGLGVVALSACWPGRGNSRVRQLEELGRRDPRRGVVGRHRLSHPDRRVHRPDAGRSSIPDAAHRGIANGMSGSGSLSRGHPAVARPR